MHFATRTTQCDGENDQLQEGGYRRRPDCLGLHLDKSAALLDIERPQPQFVDTVDQGHALIGKCRARGRNNRLIGHSAATIGWSLAWQVRSRFREARKQESQ